MRHQEPSGVLLIPEKGDPRSLLRESLVGARPPIAISGTDIRIGASVWRLYSGPMQGLMPRALVLAWNGKKAPSGIFHAWHQADDVSSSVIDMILYENWVDLRNLAMIVQRWKLGVVISLGADSTRRTI